MATAKKRREWRHRKYAARDKILKEATALPEKTITHIAGSIAESEHIVAQHKKAYSKAPKITPEELLWQVGGNDAKAWTAGLLKNEWSMKYSSMDVRRYLEDIKGYTVAQATRIIHEIPKDEWHSTREDLLDTITTDLIKRQIDLIAEVQASHINSANTLLTRVTDILSKNVMKMRKKEKDPADATKSIWVDVDAPLRSVDILNLATSLEKAQQIYRRAMGLPNDEGGLAQIIEKLNIMQETSKRNTQINIQNNLHIHPQKKNKVDELAESLQYEDIMEFVKYNRERARKAEAAQLAITDGNKIVQSS